MPKMQPLESVMSGTEKTRCLKGSLGRDSQVSAPMLRPEAACNMMMNSLCTNIQGKKFIEHSNKTLDTRE